MSSALAAAGTEVKYGQASAKRRAANAQSKIFKVKEKLLSLDYIQMRLAEW